MGLDFLEIVMGLEDTFDVAITAADWETAGASQPGDITAGEIHFLVGAKIKEQGRSVPQDLWPQVQRVLAEVLRKQQDEIHADSRLGQDLGMM